MALLFKKFQEAVKTLAKSPTFARDPRHLQFEADMNRLFLYTSYNRLGKNAEEKDADEIIEMANKAALADQQKQVQENIHFQLKNICGYMDDILMPDPKSNLNPSNLDVEPQNKSRPSGLGMAIGRTTPIKQPVIPETRPLTRAELSEQLKSRIGYTVEVKPSQIPHKEAGNGLFITGEAEVGSIIAIYPGVIYSPAYYRHIPGYPRVDSSNTYLITRYDGTIINAQPWGFGGEAREIWNGYYNQDIYESPNNNSKSDKIWKMLSKPVQTSPMGNSGEVLERRNPLAFAHFANHPGKGTEPNVMVCPYDFPVVENEMRTYIPNLVFGGEEGIKMKRLGSFWFKYGGSGESGTEEGAIIKTVALVATRAVKDEEVVLNYRLSNTKRRPQWYFPVNEEEDRRRWS